MLLRNQYWWFPINNFVYDFSIDGRNLITFVDRKNNMPVKLTTYFPTYSLRGTEYFFRIHSVFSYQEFPRILWKSNIYIRSHKCPPPVPIRSQIYPVHTPISHLLKIYLNIILPLDSVSPYWFLSNVFPTNPV